MPVSAFVTEASLLCRYPILHIVFSVCFNLKGFIWCSLPEGFLPSLTDQFMTSMSESVVPHLSCNQLLPECKNLIFFRWMLMTDRDRVSLCSWIEGPVLMHHANNKLPVWEELIDWYGNSRSCGKGAGVAGDGGLQVLPSPWQPLRSASQQLQARPGKRGEHI